MLRPRVLSPVDGSSDEGAGVSCTVGATGAVDGARVPDGAGSIVRLSVGPAVVGAAEATCCGAVVAGGSTTGPGVSCAAGCTEGPGVVSAGAVSGEEVALVGSLVGDVVCTGVGVMGTCHQVGGSLSV